MGYAGLVRQAGDPPEWLTGQVAGVSLASMPSALGRGESGPAMAS